MKNVKKYADLIKAYSKDSYLKLTRGPMQMLNHPFIVPGTVYKYQLWDWDFWLTNIAIRQIITDNGGTGEAEFLECEKGCILNFLEHIKDDEKIPVVIDGICELWFMKDSKTLISPASLSTLRS